MIEYDYELIRDEGDEIRKFIPSNIPKKLDNIVYIEGPNSCGKSTLLNILAIGLYGQKNETIHKPLRIKMDSLLDETYNKLTFNFEIKNDNNSLSLHAEKKYPDKKEIIVYEIKNGKKNIITNERFLRNYNLIYDIPIDPTARLKQLLVDIKNDQIRYGNAVGGLRERINDIIAEIRNAKDPNILSEKNKQLEGIETKIKTKQRTRELLKDDLDILEKYTYARCYVYYDYEWRKIGNRITEKKKTKSKDKRDRNKVDKDYSELIKGLELALYEARKNFDKLTNQLDKALPKEEHNHLEIWNRIDLGKTFGIFKFDENLIPEINHFITILEKIKLEHKDDQRIKEIDLYKYLIQVLQSFKDLTIMLPGGKTISDFIADLRKLEKEKEPHVILFENISKSLELLHTLREQINHIENNFLTRIRKLRVKSVSAESYVIESSNELIDRLEEQKRDTEKKLNFFEDEWIKKGRPTPDDFEKNKDQWDKYTGYTEEQLLHEINELKDEIINYNAGVEKLKVQQGMLEKDIHRLEEKEEHPYQNYLGDLEDNLLVAAQTLEQKLRRDFFNYINELLKDKGKLSKDKKKEKYYDAIFKYLAKRISFVRHLSEEYKVKYIDVINETIITEGKKKIRFADMGTGQSQSAYLLGKLNTSDDRKIIAFFDEVAMMDSSSLEPIYKKLRTLNQQNRLLAGIIVQRGDKVKVISKVGK